MPAPKGLPARSRRRGQPQRGCGSRPGGDASPIGADRSGRFVLPSGHSPLGLRRFGLAGSVPSTKRLRVARTEPVQPLWGWIIRPGRAGSLHEAPARRNARRNVSPEGAGPVCPGRQPPDCQPLKGLDHSAWPGRFPPRSACATRCPAQRQPRRGWAGLPWSMAAGSSAPMGLDHLAWPGRFPPRSACATQCPAQRQPRRGWFGLSKSPAAGSPAPMGLGFALGKRGAAPLGLGQEAGADGRRAGSLHEAPALRAKGGWFPGLGWSLCPLKTPV